MNLRPRNTLHTLPVPHPRRIPPRSLGPDELRKIVKKYLPAWLKACAADADAIVMHEAAFSSAGGDLFLLGCALKYAAHSGKTVHVTCGGKAGRSGPALRSVSFEAVYRERLDNPVRQGKSPSRNAKRRARRNI
jgi:hypothetical protein